MLRLLHLRQLGRQPLRTFLAAIAVAAGVSLTVGSSLLIHSIAESERELLLALAGPADLRVVGARNHAWISEGVVERVARVDGVASVVPTVAAVGIAERRDRREVYFVAVGVDCRVEALIGAFGCEQGALKAPRRHAPVLMSAALRRELGSGAVVRTDIGRIRTDGVATNDSLNGTNRGRVAIFDLRTAQHVFSRGDRADMAYVQLSPGADRDDVRARIEKVIGPTNYVVGRGELGPSDGSGGPLLPILGIVAIMALGLSALLVYNIVSLSLEERRRDLAVAGAVGVSPRSVTAGALTEAGVLGLIGGAIGVLAGIGFAKPMVDAVSALVFEQGGGLRLGMHISIGAVVTGFVLGVLTAVLAAWIPIRRLRHLDIAAELHGRASRSEETPRRALLRLGVLGLCAAVAIALSRLAARDGALETWQPRVGTLALASSALLLFGAVGAGAPLVLGLTLRRLKGRGGPLRVALSNLVSRPRRTGVLAAAVGMAVGAAGMLAALVPSIRGAVTSGYGEAAEGRVYVSTLPLNNIGGDARLGGRVLDELASLPGVASVERTRCVRVDDALGLLGVCAYEGARTTPFRTVAGEVNVKVLQRGEAIVGTSAARDRALRPGSILRIPTPDGVARIRVAGIWAHSNYNGYMATISYPLLERLYGAEPPPGAYLRPEPGTSARELASAVERAKIDPDLYALTPSVLSARLADAIDDQVAPFWVVQRLLLFVALVATLSTLLLVGVQRQRELGVLGAVGFSPSGLARMTVAEAVATALAGALLGAIAGVGLFEVVRNAGVAAIGFPAPFRFDVVSTAASSALAIVIVVAGGIIPAWRTSRLQIVEAIRDE